MLYYCLHEVIEYPAVTFDQMIMICRGKFKLVMQLLHVYITKPRNRISCLHRTKILLLRDRPREFPVSSSVKLQSKELSKFYRIDASLLACYNGMFVNCLSSYALIPRGWHSDILVLRSSSLVKVLTCLIFDSGPGV